MRREVRVLAMNAYLLPTGIRPSTHKDERLADIVYAVKDYDVVCLCEMWSCLRDRPQRAIDMARTHGLAHAARGPPRRFFSLSDSGLLTLSRHEVALSHSLLYDTCAGPIDSCVNNGVVYTRVHLQRSSGAASTPSCTSSTSSSSASSPPASSPPALMSAAARGTTPTHIHVFNTHLNSDTSLFLATVPGRHAAVRRRQLQQLKQFMDEMTGNDGAAVLVCGDMNIDANSKEMAEEYQSMLALLDVHDVIHSTRQHLTPAAGSTVAHDEDATDVQETHLPTGRARPTLGDIVLVNGERMPGERLFTSTSDQMSEQCVDYVLFQPDKHGRVRVVHSDVLTMEADRSRPYQRLSDHLAVTVHLHID